MNPVPTPDHFASDDATSPALTRELLAGAAGAIGGVVLAGLPAIAAGQQTGSKVAAAAANTSATAAVASSTPPLRPVVPLDATIVPGAPTSPVGSRSAFATPTRGPTGEITGSSLTPFQDLSGTITPSDLHFERHHAGIPAIDPARHALVIHGLVDRPLSFSLDDLMRFPQVTRTYFVECSGNGRAAFRDPKPEMTPQKVVGLMSNTEWTGVPLATLFREAGVKKEAAWFLAEGGDACLMTRSVPIAKAWDDALVVWGQNGEPLRPEQGYPMRLLLPGWEGNINVKWLRRLELGTRPWATRWETAKYTDPLLNGTARIYSFVLDAKSIITSPSTPGTITATGWRPVSGLAWSGRGTIVKVEVSTDNGTSWHDAELTGPALPKAAVRFQYMWEWTGKASVLLSRATDETGYTQPTRTQLIAVRGPGTDYHFNQIVGWKVGADGQLSFHGES